MTSPYPEKKHSAEQNTCEVYTAQKASSTTFSTPLLHTSIPGASIWQLWMRTVRKNKVFVIGYYLVLVIGLYPLCMWDKMQVLLFINQHHHPYLDTFFYYWTNLGSGIAYIALLLMLYLCRSGLTSLWLGLISFLTMSIVVQTCKRVFFYSHARPLKAFIQAEQVAALHLVEKVDLLMDLSFPSGHAATIFTAISFLSLISKRKHTWYTILLLSIAMITAYSRVYLCQHFYTDIYVGACVGGTTAIIIYVLVMHAGVPSWVTGLWQKYFKW